ncbi:MAG TPA: bifunctional DNA-formamidopyrimidine glycosylase/DNA-(apurinic or apyrimidinic site) lyase [Vicinamibacterales bacterium]|nr:bifunctional DNA-formamidopyrimidine glycosylase/DNA-(apurinic or apyrimidinic site) lyase [Vicinamibacterales bacterium]
MPELPEVELVRLELQPVMEGARFESVILNRPNLRTAFPQDFADRLVGHSVRSLHRRGKYLLAALSSSEILVMHLGMSGSFRVNSDADLTDPHDHVVFQMSSGATVVFNDPRRFGFINLVSPDALTARAGVGALGPEPLSEAFDGGALARACRGRKTSLKAALSDQRVVAGLGNIYVVEALHRAHLSPRRRASTIATAAGKPRESAVRLAQAIKNVLRSAVTRGERNRLCVYDREGQRCPTRRCSGIIRRITQSNRSTFFCPVCQR